MDRRTFLASTAAVTVGCGSRGEVEVERIVPTSGRRGDIEAAERLLEVSYTPPERALIAESIDEQLDQVRARRALPLSFALAPACSFDPVLRDQPPRAVTPAWKPNAVARTPLPTDPADIAFASIGQLHGWLTTRAITSTALTELYLERLETHAPRLFCLAASTRERALEEARSADAELAAGKVRGPLHGIPYGAKDLLDTAGIGTGWGAEPYRDRVPDTDAVVVQRLRQAGAVLIGKLSLGALAYGDLWYGGRTRNPWNPDEGSSGSSAGSAAATAAGLVGFAIGTETLGSIVSPSMRCGTTGLRPTFGRVARTGAMPLCWSLDKIGPLCRSVEDTMLVLQAIDGPDGGDPSSTTPARPFGFDAARGAKGRRIGFVPAWLEEDQHALDRAALEVLKRAGATTVELRAPDLPVDSLLPILSAEAAAAFEQLTLSGDDDQLAWQEKEAWPNTFRTARLISAVDLIQADRLRRRVMGAYADFFDGLDAVLAPAFSPILVATNFTGHPCLVQRVGFEQRHPIYLDSFSDKDESKPLFRAPRATTLCGQLFDEGTLCELGLVIERELAVSAERPPLG